MSADPPQAAPATGRLVAGRYRLVRTLGSGGMASVYEAVDEKLGRRVAVKELHEHLLGHAVLATRFSREALAVASVNHPGIVAIYDSVPGDPDHGIRPALVMEYVDGRTLRDFLDDHGSLEPDDVVTLGRALCDALGAVHAAGLVHRDVTPSNVLLCRSGEVKLADFGIATTDGMADLTATGAFVGTARYLSPEQLADRAVDGRSDLYSLGLVLYEAATGIRPFERTHEAAVAVARLEHDPDPPARITPGVPKDLSAAIMWALQRAPVDRPQRADALGESLAAVRLDAGARVDVTDEMDRPVEVAPAPATARGTTPAPAPAPAPARAPAAPRRRPRWSTVFASVLVVSSLLTVAALIGIIG